MGNLHQLGVLLRESWVTFTNLGYSSVSHEYPKLVKVTHDSRRSTPSW
jgi:hypothetical protein